MPRLDIRITAAEKSFIEAAAAASKISVSEFVRRCLADPSLRAALASFELRHTEQLDAIRRMIISLHAEHTRQLIAIRNDFATRLPQALSTLHAELTRLIVGDCAGKEQ